MEKKIGKDTTENITEDIPTDILENASPEAVIAWAIERFGEKLVIVNSFADCILIDMAVKINPGVQVLFLDTGFHFQETLDYLQSVKDRYNLNLNITTANIHPSKWPCGTTRCCEFRKVNPLKEALSDKSAWITGIKRVDNENRRQTPVVHFDKIFNLVKINPLVTWTDADIAIYETEHNLLVHPLKAKGYLSIGCAPTTTPVLLGDDPRSGRWRGDEKTECGLHLTPTRIQSTG